MKLLCGRSALALLVAVMLVVVGANAGTTQYEYDELGRLRSVTPSTGAVISYNFDGAGNRTQVTHGGGTPYTEALAMTVGTSVSGPITLRGYSPGVMGSLVPNTLIGGKTVQQFHETWVNNGNTFQSTFLRIAGFNANPAASWLASVSCRGNTRTGASATYTYSSGTATWQWNSPTFTSIGFFTPGAATCTFVHG